MNSSSDADIAESNSDYNHDEGSDMTEDERPLVSVRLRSESDASTLKEVRNDTVVRRRSPERPSILESGVFDSPTAIKIDPKLATESSQTVPNLSPTNHHSKPLKQFRSMTAEMETVPSVAMLSMPCCPLPTSASSSANIGQGGSSQLQTTNSAAIPRPKHSFDTAGSGTHAAAGGAASAAVAAAVAAGAISQGTIEQHQRTGRSKQRSSRLMPSKADLFAAKVASAVDEAEGTETEEAFVYDSHPSTEYLRRPQSRTTSTLSLSSNARIPMMKPKLSAPNGITSRKSHLQLDSSLSPTKRGENDRQEPQPGAPVLASAQPLREFTKTRKPSRKSCSPSRQEEQQRRRSSSITSEHNSDRPNSRRVNSFQAKYDHLKRWRTHAYFSDQASYHDINETNEESDESTSKLLPRDQAQRMPHYGTRNSFNRSNSGHAGQNQANMVNPHDYIGGTRQSMIVRAALWSVFIIICVLLSGFVFGLLLASSRPLINLHIVRINDVITSDRELLFSLVTRAKNPGLVSASIVESDLDIFAYPAKQPPLDLAAITSGGAILLGNAEELESPLKFPGGFLNPQFTWSSAQVRLCFEHNNTMWNDLLKNDFDLVVRGVLKYDSFMRSGIRAAVSASQRVKCESIEATAAI